MTLTCATRETTTTPRAICAEWRAEPALDDILSDPVVHMVMARDGLDPDDVRRFIETTADRIRNGWPASAALPARVS